MFTGKPAHLHAFDYLGRYQYFLTFCTYSRRKCFVTPGEVDSVSMQILRAADEERISLLAYCYMPDHLHLLVEGEADDSDCLRFIKRAKQFSGFHYKARFGQRLRQRYGYEHTLRGEESALSVTRYILENPMRAGLAARVEDYPFLGSSRYTLVQILDSVQLKHGWYRRARRSG